MTGPSSTVTAPSAPASSTDFEVASSVLFFVSSLCCVPSPAAVDVAVEVNEDGLSTTIVGLGSFATGTGAGVTVVVVAAPGAAVEPAAAVPEEATKALKLLPQLENELDRVLVTGGLTLSPSTPFDHVESCLPVTPPAMLIDESRRVGRVADVDIDKGRIPGGGVEPGWRELVLLASALPLLTTSSDGCLVACASLDALSLRNDPMFAPHVESGLVAPLGLGLVIPDEAVDGGGGGGFGLVVPSDAAEPPREKDFGVNEKGLRKLVCVAVLSCCSSPSVGAVATVEACVGTPVPLLALR